MQVETFLAFRIWLGMCCICEPVPVKLAKVLISLAHFLTLSPSHVILMIGWYQAQSQSFIILSWLYLDLFGDWYKSFKHLPHMPFLKTQANKSKLLAGFFSIKTFYFLKGKLCLLMQMNLYKCNNLFQQAIKSMVVARQLFIAFQF